MIRMSYDGVGQGTVISYLNTSLFIEDGCGIDIQVTLNRLMELETSSDLGVIVVQPSSEAVRLFNFLNLVGGINESKVATIMKGSVLA